MRVSQSVHAILMVGIASSVLQCTIAFRPSLLLSHHHQRGGVGRGARSNTRLSTQAVIEYDDFLPNPNPALSATQVVEACMNTLLVRRDGGGLEVCFNFSSDRCRAALGGSLERFNEYATNPVFGFMVQCSDWRIVNVGSEIPGTATRGAMQTVLIDAIQTERSEEQNQERRFLWTLQKERRPPRQNCWVVHEVIYVKNAFQLTL